MNLLVTFLRRKIVLKKIESLRDSVKRKLFFNNIVYEKKLKNIFCNILRDKFFTFVIEFKRKI